MLAQEIIRLKRDKHALAAAHIDAFVLGLVDGSWSEQQAAAMTMALFLNGMSDTETVALTRAMTRSGDVLEWSGANLAGPVLDKHSSGGVGDKVSLVLAPVVAACGGYVPMVSGRGLGHTGGTLDKLDSIPGYVSTPDVDVLRTVLRDVGCAIVGQTAEIAPADGHLYALRDVTATVESIPLITASILSKKLAAGVQGLVMDVKCGNGAFAPDLPTARSLGRSIAQVAIGADLPTHAFVTDMNEVLGHTAGNALEVHEALDMLHGRGVEPRLVEVTRRLSAELLVIGRLAGDVEEGLAKVDAVLANGRALERFARMVSALGGPVDFIERPHAYLPVAPVQRKVLAERAGWVERIDTRDVGLVVVELGGGRRQASDAVDHRVGLTAVASIGQPVRAGDVIAVVHAADADAAAVATKRLAELIHIGEQETKPCDVMIEQVTAA